MNRILGPQPFKVLKYRADFTQFWITRLFTSATKRVTDICLTLRQESMLIASVGILGLFILKKIINTVHQQDQCSDNSYGLYNIFFL